VKLDELWFPWRMDVVNLTGPLTSQRSEVQLLVGRGLLECDPLLVKDHVGVTSVLCLIAVDTRKTFASRP